MYNLQIFSSMMSLPSGDYFLCCTEAFSFDET